MNKREEALHEGLGKNEEETERWQKYEAEHKQASENLINFSKKLSVHVMIPIGTKALIPGKLRHTNETFVSHYGKLFSKCSAYQAGKICKYRIKMAKERLEKLQQERDMFENKLKKPYENGVLPSSNELEIIEDYDEEKEILWREEHKIKLKHQKLKEKEERNDSNNKNSDKDIFDMLEDLEIMDELEAELEGVNLQDENIIQKLMSGEIQINEKKRISHYNNIVIGEREKSEDSVYSNSNEFPILDSLYKKYKVSKDLNGEIDFTNNNNIPNNDFEIDSNNDNSTRHTGLLEEVLQMEEEMINLSHYKQVKYLTKKIKHYEKNIDTMKVKDADQLNEKMHKLEILDYLYDHLQFLEDENLTDNNSSNNGNKKKKISFAAHDEIQIINKDEKVSDMLKNNTKQDFKRDIIRLDEIFSNESEENINLEKNDIIIDKKKLIRDRVENNIKYVQENQNHSDFDFIGKLLDPIPPKSLKIKFKHSSQTPPFLNETNKEPNENVINSPSDIYKLFSEYSPQNVNAESELSKTHINRNENAYVDVKAEFSNSTWNATNTEKKPILKNKEVKSGVSSQKTKKSKAKNLENPALTTAFDIVMGDIVEKPITEPEALPKERFIDSHAPRKRISRFKQTRNESLSVNTKVDS